ncbi:hypothetical protein GCM10025867_05780 [Frondihabitans sucicola]|uniref:DUF4383 domain-containing protein n=1 Tax=Frondihabitans sucicola TaxID=1268041 RepID=A0ABN6XTK2_9MICO|nr:DUF4383 domain-containing protein [Frondihabitans sucicola]BDZ48337.1 hypothetical protein GCM10025867_05780 [Frondihabitans sucicola]
MSQSPNRLLGVIFGTIFLIIGLFGFFLATPFPFATAEGAVFIGLFAANAALSGIHVVIGAILVLCGLTGTLSAKIAGVLIGVGLFAFGIFGFVAAHTSANIFALNTPDSLLHLLVGLLLAAAGFASDKVILRKPVAA